MQDPLSLAVPQRTTGKQAPARAPAPALLLRMGIVVALALLFIGPLWREAGLPNSADGPLHLHRSAAVARAVAEGVFWPRWHPDVYGGLGAPTFHYYSPIFYLLTGGLHGWGVALDTAAKLVLSVAFLLCGLACYGWLARLFSAAPAATAGTGLYLAQPHLFREFYFQGDYPQLLALLLLPCCLWSFTALHDEGNPVHWLLAPLSLALLVTAHNLTAMIGAVLLAVYWLLLGIERRNRPGWLRGVAAALLAASLSAFFWMPALGDAGLVQVDNLQRDFFRYDQYFLSWRELLAPPPVLDARAANPPFPHSPGWAAWIAIGSGLLAVVWRTIRPQPSQSIRFWTVAGVIIALGFMLLTLPVSALLWETLPGLKLLQFPSRLLGPASVGVALAGGGAVASSARLRQQWVTATIALVVVALTVAVFLFPAHHYLRFPALTRLDTQAYEQQSGVWGTTSGNEFLPRRADVDVATGPIPAPTASAEWTLQWTSPHGLVAERADPSAVALTLPVHAFPAWRAFADGQPVAVRASEAGWVQITPTAPVTRVELRWQGTAWQQRGQWLAWIGVLFWMALVALVSLRRWRRPPGPRRQAQIETDFLPWALLPLVTLLLLVAARQGIASADLGWFQRYSPPGEVMGVAHPTQIQIGGDEQPAVTLLGWALLSSPRPRPGDTLRVRLYWQAPEPMAEDLHSFVHLYTPERQQSWAIAQNPNPARVPTSRWRPALYYVDDLSLPLPIDLPPTRYTLAVGMVTLDGVRLSSRSGDGLIHLGEVSVRPLRAGGARAVQPDVSAQAQVGESLHLRGYDLLPAPGGPILRLYWRADAPIARDYSTFVHLYGEGGARIAQFDGPPLAGMLPMSAWPAGSLLIDRRQLLLPTDIRSGDYTFEVGLYDPVEGRPLSMTPDAGSSEHFIDGRALRIPLHVPGDE